MSRQLAAHAAVLKRAKIMIAAFAGHIARFRNQKGDLRYFGISVPVLTF